MDFRRLFRLVVYWKFLLVVLTPLLLLPVPLVIQTEAAQCGYLLLIMAIFWVSEALPLAVTSLLPVAVLPPMGIMSTGDVTMNYMNGTCMFFVGGLTMALAIEKCHLNRRIALNVMRLIGTSPALLMLGFMLPTAFLSMWMSNTATAAMMVPIMEAVLEELEEDDVELKEDQILEEVNQGTVSVASGGKRESKAASDRRAMLAMAICFSANVGGTGTVVGTPPNIILISILDELGGHPLTFSAWLGFAVPLLILCMLGIWLWLQLYYIGLPSYFGLCRKSDDQESEQNEASKQDAIAMLIQTKCNELGSMSYHEASVAVLFVVLVALWLFRSPGFMIGWGDALENAAAKDISLTDATPAIAIVILLFLLPAEPTYLQTLRQVKSGADDSPESSRALLDWRTVESNLPWGLILLLGGGFAMAEASERSCLSNWIGAQLFSLDTLPNWALSLVLALIASLITQVVTNVATCSMLLPVYRQLAFDLKINPIYLMLPPTLAASFAFMLPVSSGPNAITFRASGITTIDMAKVGSVATLICFLFTIVSVNSYGYLMFNLGSFPEWADDNAASVFASSNDTDSFQCIPH